MLNISAIAAGARNIIVSLSTTRHRCCIASLCTRFRARGFRHSALIKPCCRTISIVYASGKTRCDIFAVEQREGRHNILESEFVQSCIVYGLVNQAICATAFLFIFAQTCGTLCHDEERYIPTVLAVLISDLPVKMV